MDGYSLYHRKMGNDEYSFLQIEGTLENTMSKLKHKKNIPWPN